MTVVVVTPPTAPVLSAADAKVLCPALANDSDALVDALVAAATKEIDGPDGWLGRALVTQTLEMRTECFPLWKVQLPYRPIQSVTSVKYFDADGADQTLSSSVYALAGDVLILGWQQSWPSARWQQDSVRIRYVAGYGSPGTAVPANVRYAVALMASNLRSLGSADMALRSETVDGVGSQTFTDASALVQAMDGTVKALLAPLRVFA